MRKLLLDSLILACIALPWRAARDPLPARALRRALLWVVTFNVMYLIILLFVIPRIS